MLHTGPMKVKGCHNKVKIKGCYRSRVPVSKMILSSEFVVIVLLEELGVDYLCLFTGLKPL